MTLTELNNYRSRRIQLSDEIELLERLRDKAVPGSPGLDDMPHAPGVSDKVGSLAIAIVDLEMRIPALKQFIEETEKPVIDFINSIDDDWTRIIFRLRYQEALTWSEVADYVGAGNTADSVKKICYRYLKVDDNGWNS